MINASLMMVYPNRMIAKMATLSILLACVWLPAAVAQNNTTTTQPSIQNSTTPSSQPSSNNNVTSTSPTIAPIISPTASPTMPPTVSPTMPPTVSPTMPPTLSPIVSPTTSPTLNPTTMEPSPYPSISWTPSLSPTTSWRPSSTPTTSTSPTSSPSSTPSTTPTISSVPTSQPSISSEPSSLPTSGTPTSAPIPLPTASPLVAPSAAPSWNSTITATGRFQQLLTVNNGKEFDDVEKGIYEQAVMQQYTDKFGEMVAKPFITTKCKVIGQNLAGRRRRSHFDNSVDDDEEPIRRLGSRKNAIQNNEQQQQQFRQLQSDTELTLVVIFTMEYTSRYGIDVSEYPKKFQTYINGNLPAVTLDMQNKFLPVSEAMMVLLFFDEPTPKPTTKEPTLIPTAESSVVPTTQFPSTSPTLPIPPPSPTKQPTDGNPDGQKSFIIGLAAGLGGATAIVILLIWYMRRKNARIRAARQFSQGGGENDESIEIISADSPVAAEIGGSGNSGGVNRSVVVIGGRDATDSIFSKDTILSNPSMVSGGGSGSFSSDSDQNHENNGLKSLQDEFDMHKNQNMELMTGGASLAMTRALMEDEDNMDKNQWSNSKRGKGGMDDPESIEANALCETHDWLRKNEKSSLEERNAFFQQILNKMVYTVRQGLNPSDGTSIIHSCAAMLGLQLENDLPNNVLLVTGLLKTKDTTQGRKYLIEAFEPFGDIESAAIASSNKGFGFVRFVHPRSVQRALERFRTSEIEVQDVSVMIRGLLLPK